MGYRAPITHAGVPHTVKMCSGRVVISPTVRQLKPSSPATQWFFIKCNCLAQHDLSEIIASVFLALANQSIDG